MKFNTAIANITFVTICLIFTSIDASAQLISEGLKFSSTSVYGTSRSMGIGGAMGSIGADFSSLSVNPAGIGVYRRGEVMLTPSLKFSSANSTYIGETAQDNNTKFSVPNIGMVITKSALTGNMRSRNWKATSFGFGYNKTADFNRNYYYTAKQNESSQSELFALDANQNLNEFLTYGTFVNDYTARYLGYHSYLIDTFGGTGTFNTIVDYTKGIRQTNSVKERGGINELLFSFGGNYKEKLMLGATVAFPILRYNRTSNYSEADEDQLQDFFSDYNYTEELRMRGSGINAKLGAIFVPVSELRLGLAFHTPTLFQLTETFNAGIYTNTENWVGEQSILGSTTEFQYNLTTPWKGIVSASVLLGKRGFFTVDYEFVNYAAMRYRLNTVTNEEVYGVGYFTTQERALNDGIKSTYKSASNIRGGLELKLDNFMLRGGAGFYGSPFKQSQSFSTSRMDFSLGAGYREEHFFLDIAFIHSQFNEAERPYIIPYSGNVIYAPLAKIKNSMNTVAVTAGLKF